jgi:hypothetical protein
MGDERRVLDLWMQGDIAARRLSGTAIPRRADPKARQLTLSVASGGLPVPEHARRPTAAISTDVPMRMIDRQWLGRRGAAACASQRQRAAVVVLASVMASCCLSFAWARVPNAGMGKIRQNRSKTADSAALQMRRDSKRRQPKSERF